MAPERDRATVVVAEIFDHLRGTARKNFGINASLKKGAKAMLHAS